MASNESTPAARIKAAFQLYSNTLKRADERHAYWNSTARELVFSTLSALSEEMKPLRTIEEKSVRNYDTVCLGFMPMPTSIVLKQGPGAKGLIRFGGYLFYSQVFNGKILVGISYPRVETLQEPAPNKGFALLDPEEITREKILDHVEHFLVELNADEKSPSMEEELQRPRLFGFASWTQGSRDRAGGEEKANQG